MVVNSRRIRDFLRCCDLLSERVFEVFLLVEEQHQMVLARSKLRHFHARGTCILERKMLRAGANTGPLIFGVNVYYSDNQ